MKNTRWKLYTNLKYAYSLLTNIYKIALLIICTIYPNDYMSNICITFTECKF